MKEHVIISIRITTALLVITCGVYPLLVFAVGQLAFRQLANGSLVTRDGRVIGSAIIGQNFTSDRYFQSRPSAVDYDAMSSGGSNLGPTSKKLLDNIKTRAQSIPTRPIPADAVTTSASGFDPHISPQNAFMQISRVAKARGVPEARVRALVERRIESRFLGIFGEPRVNVFLLNLDLDRGVS